MDLHDVLDFLRLHRLAVQSSVSPVGLPQAAMIGYAVTDDLELVFDTVDTTRKAVNLRNSPYIALTVGGWDPGDPRTVQYEGVVDEPAGEELARLKAIYYEAFPDGPSRLAWPGLIYLRVKPRWIRLSDYRVDPPGIFEFDGVSFPAPGGNTQ